ncbi:MAG: ComEC/Rec2 family competence protein [Candidatus Onthomonas sp.]
MAGRSKKRGSKGGKATPLATLFALIFFLAALIYYEAPDLMDQLSPQATQPVDGDGLTVHFLDVGQGDAALLTSGGEHMLIDGGPRSASEELLADLDRLGVERLDYLVATHPHEDHIGGLPDVVETISVEQCWMPDDVADSKIYEDFLLALDEGDVSVTVPEVGDSFAFGDCTVTVLAPLQIADDHNNNSLVLKVVCGETSFLFTGDMEEDEEEDLLAARSDLSADVLKVAHHGSAYTSSTRFLQQVEPELAVISCGEGNSYGHPHSELIQRLEYLEIPIYRTDLQGEITVSSDGEQLTVSAEREAAE